MEVRSIFPKSSGRAERRMPSAPERGVPQEERHVSAVTNQRCTPVPRISTVEVDGNIIPLTTELHRLYDIRVFYHPENSRVSSGSNR
jgi:hypothetical protein